MAVSSGIRVSEGLRSTITIKRPTMPARMPIEPDSQPEPNGRSARGVSSSDRTLARNLVVYIACPRMAVPANRAAKPRPYALVAPARQWFGKAADNPGEALAERD